jgi:hypothetical protein
LPTQGFDSTQSGFQVSFTAAVTGYLLFKATMRCPKRFFYEFFLTWSECCYFKSG